jgi:hypothetical protein
MSKHQFFYSTKCRFCQAFLEELARTPYVPEFQLICVDPRPGRPPLPSWLKSVPSMLTAGSSKPLVGPGPVNNWLFERRLGGKAEKSAQQALEERNAPLAMPTYNPDVAPRPNAAPRGPAAMSAQRGPVAMSAPQGAAGPSAAGGDAEGPLAYHAAEMGAGKWSDNYSRLDTDFNSQNGWNPIGKNFESLVAGPAAGGQSAANRGGAGGPKPSAKEQQLLSEFERYTAARDRDIPTGPQRR